MAIMISQQAIGLRDASLSSQMHHRRTRLPKRFGQADNLTVSSPRVRYVIVMVGLVLLFGLSGVLLALPAINDLKAGDTAVGGWLLALWIFLDLVIIVGGMLIVRTKPFRYEPIDWTLPRSERTKR